MEVFMSRKVNLYNNKDKSLIMYLKYLDGVKILTREEEVELFTEYKKIKGIDLKKEKEIFNKIFDSIAKFVFVIASQYSKDRKTLMDLVQEGNIGLIEAINRFDLKFNIRLSTYSAWWIRQKILRYLSKNIYLIKIPLNKNVKINNFKKAENYLLETLSRNPTIEELSNFLNISIKDVRNLYIYSSKIVYLNSNVKYDDESFEIQDLIEDNRVCIEDSFIKSYVSKLIREEISKLDLKEQIVINMRFGIGFNNESYSLEQVGDVFNLTRERIRQIQQKAISKLKNKKILEELTC